MDEQADRAAVEAVVESAQIRRADTLHRPRDAEVIDRIGRLRTLAARCVYFCDEQAAIKRAQQANRRQVDAVLGAIELTDPQPVDEIGAFTQQLNGVLDAYRRLVMMLLMVAKLSWC